MSWYRKGLRYSSVSNALFIISVACVSCATVNLPPSSNPPSEELQQSGTDGYLIFLDGNDCNLNVVGEASSAASQSISFGQDDRFGDNLARSLVLLDVAANTQVWVFASSDIEQDDDWTLITTKEPIDVYCVKTFEATYEDDAVQVVHLHQNGLDGMVSRVTVGTGSAVVFAPDPPQPTAPPIQPTDTEVAIDVATSTPTIPSATGAACVPTDTTRELTTVTRVVDGDTIDVIINGHLTSLRYIGIDTPERGRPLSSEATGRNASLVEGMTITLVKDVTETDVYDRLLRYVFAGGVFVNYELVRSGYALASTYPPDVACAETLAQAQSQAEYQARGLWFSTPTPIAIQIVPPPAQPNCHPSYEGACLSVDVGDYDCGCGSGNGPNYLYTRVRVVGYDEFGLDREGDGWGCECYP